MFLLRASSNLSLRISCTIIMVLAVAPPPASAQTGVIAFRRLPNLLYAMRGDGSGRIALPLPPLPQPVDGYQYWDPWV